MTKNEMIEMLVDDDINDWHDRDDQADYLSYLLRRGFKGYDDYTEEELRNELFDRELIEETA